MSDSESRETTAGGLVGRIVGKAKATVGSLVGNDDLQREGNLQEAQAEAEQLAAKEEQAADLRKREVAVEEQRAEASAERDRLRTDIEADDRKERVAENETRRQHEIAVAAERERAAIEKREALQWRASSATETAARHRRAADAAEISRLEKDAADAELTADIIDPEAK